tara:strand:- start:444 stop:3794 length:3351 start_codon:yes stop_codon:yes gene_type:complete
MNKGYLPLRSVGVKPRSPSFGQVISAQFGYNYDPIHEYLYNEYVVGTEHDPNYNALEDLEGYELYSQHLLSAQNADHMASLKRGIDDNIRRREIIGEAGLGYNLMAGFFDPVNLLALPLGGPTVGVGRSMVRVGAGVGLTQVGQEGLRAPFDPLNTKEEVFNNIAMATAGGAVFGGLFSIPITRKGKMMAKLMKDMDEAKAASKGISVKSITPDGKVTVSKKVDKNKQIVSRETNEPVAHVGSDLQLRNNQTGEIIEDTSKNKEITFDITNPFGMARSWYTDSWMYKGITTNMKRVLQNENLPDSVKFAFVKLAGDSGIKLNLHKYGIAIDPSVYQKSKIREGEWVSVYDQLVKLYTKETDQKILNPGGFDYNLTNNRHFIQWLEDLELKRIQNIKSESTVAREAQNLLTQFWETWRVRLDSEGLLGGKNYLQIAIQRTKTRIETKQKIADAYIRQNKSVDKVNAQIKKLKDELQNYENRLAKGESESGMYLPRYWSLSKISRNRNVLVDIIAKYYLDNPLAEGFINKKTGKELTEKELKLLNSEESVRQRAEATVKAIENKGDLFDIEAQDLVANNMFDGFIEVSSKHIKQRNLDIPTYLVADFIEMNPISVMKAYTGKIAPHYEWSKQFGRGGLEKTLSDIEDAIINAGLSQKTVQRVHRDFVHLYDRVMKTVVKEPHALNQKIRRVLNDFATLNFLGSAGFSTLPDYAKIIMEHELGTVFKTLSGLFKDQRVSLSKSEARIAGEALEILMGDTHLRFSDDMINNPFGDGFYAKGMDKVKQGFFFLNGLAPLTNIAKRLDGIMRGHTIIDYALKAKKNSATQFQKEWLARNNITQKMIDEIADKAGWQNTKKDNTGLYLANSETWLAKGVSQETLDGFRSSMNSGIGNTILMGTPADKPIAVDGVFYVPYNIGRLFGMKQDNRVKGYSRIENGLLALPFQFLSYSFAASNKITASFAQGTLTNPIIGMFAAMGLGYMSLEIKYAMYPYILDEMSWRDKFARAFDASGLMALHSDLAYSVLNNATALGYVNDENFGISPKYKVPTEGAERTLDVAGQWIGPAGGLVGDIGLGLYQLHHGNYAEGTETLINTAPGRSLWFIKGLVGEAKRHVRNNF